MAGYGAYQDSNELAEYIKELQRTDPAAKEQWIAYTDIHSQGTRDPMKHTQDFLQGFLTHLKSGAKPPSALGDFVKLMQKKSTTFKNVWAAYCAQYGGGVNDPAKHDGNYHVQFFDYLAKQAAMSLSMSPMMMAGAPTAGVMEPPAKRMKVASGGAMAMGASGDNQKDQLVAQIKNFQRMGEQQKALWGTYADMYLGGVRDPSRHDAASLEEFCTNHNVPPAPSLVAPDMGSMNVPDQGYQFSSAPRMSPSVSDAMKETLVARIKNFQRSGPEQKEMWSSFAGSTRDPARHEVARLQEFIDSYDVP